MIQLYAILAALGLLAGAAGFGEWHGQQRGEAKIQAKWDQAEADRKTGEDKVAKEDRDAGYAMAAEYESKAHELELRYAKTSTDLRNALQRPVTCPASGIVADVLLPADTVRGMFNRSAPAGGDPPGPAASQPDAAVRRGPGTS